MPHARSPVVAILMCMAASAAFAEPVFPPGARIGLTPPKDMQVSKRFTGFEHPVKGAAITFVEMPQEAFAKLSKELSAETLKAQGVTVTNREEMKVDGKNAVLISGEQSAGQMVLRKWLLLAEDPTMTAFVVAQAVRGADNYADDDIRAALTSVAIRPPVPLEDQIAALPFRVASRAGFRPVRAVAGNSLLMTEGPKDVIVQGEQPMIVLAQSATPAPPARQRDQIARQALLANKAFKDIVFERSQGFRQKGADWHEIVARANDSASGKPIVIMQTLRFAPDSYLRMVGVTASATRDATLKRFRTLFDGVELK
jgi:hypothetical protein